MDDTEPGKETLFMAQNVMFGTIAGIGILANIFVIVVLVVWEQSRANRTVANLFIINLAIADLLFLVCLPLSMPALIDNGWTYGRFMCKFSEAVKYMNFRASICFLTTMTVDRYFAIVHSLQSRGYRTRTTTIKLCVALWIFVISISAPVIVFSDVHNSGGSTKCEIHFPGYKPDSYSNTELYDFYNISATDIPEADALYDAINDASFGENNVSGYGDPTYFGVEDIEPRMCTDKTHAESDVMALWVYGNFVFFFLLPVLTIIFCYGSIIRATILRKVPSTTSIGVQNRVAVMVGLLVSVFIICWLPFQVFELAIMPPGMKMADLNDCQVFKAIFETLAWSNSGINPILYSISSKRFREKALVAWTYMKHGKSRALALQSSQRTLQTRLHTTTGSSIKGMMVTQPSKDKPTTPNLSGRSSPARV